MACNTELNGISRVCTNISGGVVEAHAIAKEHLVSATISDGELTAADFGTGNEFAEYQFRQGQAMANQDSEIDFESSTTVFNNNITIHFKGQDLVKRNELMLLSKAQQELVVFYKLDTGIWFALGMTNADNGDNFLGARVSEINGETGQNRSDTNEFVLQIAVTEDKELPLVVAESLIDDILV